MSRTFSTNSGSLESFQCSTRCGCSPNARQIRETVDCETPGLGRHRARRPVRAAVRRRRLQRLTITSSTLRVDDRPRPPRPRLVDQPVQPIARQTAPRHLRDRRRLDTRAARATACCSHPAAHRQHDPAARRQPLRGLAPPRPPLELLALATPSVDLNRLRSRVNSSTKTTQTTNKLKTQDTSVGCPREAWINVQVSTAAPAGGASPRDAEGAAHERVDAAEVRVGPGREVARRRPRLAVGRGVKPAGPKPSSPESKVAGPSASGKAMPVVAVHGAGRR